MSKILNEKFLVESDEIDLIDFLREKMSNKSKNNIKTLLSNEMVRVNNEIITKHDYKLYNNDEVEIRNNFIISKNNKERIPILYEDNDIIVIDKPAHLLSMATKKEKMHTAYRIISDYLNKKDKNSKVFIVHRLDKETSGVIVYAKNQEMKNLLQNNWNKIVKNKEYVAVVEGTVKEDKKVIKSYLKENSEGIVYSSLKPNDGKLAITMYEKMKFNKRYTMLKINIKTGRKNQIRVHMKDIKHPIVGDKKYGSGLDPVKRLCLHARRLEIVNPKTKKLMVFQSEIPFLLHALI